MTLRIETYDHISPFVPSELVTAAGKELGLHNRNAAVAQQLEALGCRIESVAVVDEVHSAIAKQMHENGSADLLIRGSQGHGFFERLRVRSTSLHQANQGDNPILLLRPTVP